MNPARSSRFHAAAFTFLTAAIAAGCGAAVKPDGSGTVNGAHAFKVVSAIGFIDADAAMGGTVFSVVLSDTATNCADVTSRQLIPYESWSVEAVTDTTDAHPAAPLTAGTTGDAGLTFLADGGIELALAAVDAKHSNGLVDRATGGSVTYTTYSPSLIEGAFDLTMLGSDNVPYVMSGNFSAPVCTTFSPI